MCDRVEVHPHFPSPPQKMEVSGQIHAPHDLPHGTHWIGGWVENPVCIQWKRENLALPGIEPIPVSTLLYRLSYLDFSHLYTESKITVFVF
jgi:hypothetical protein